MEESNNDNPQFQWGIKRGVGGNKKDVQFYGSFTWNGIHYSLYDNVYLFKDGEPDPYVGKILKIWETRDGIKKVKILWFFLQSEILKYIEEHAPLEKEIFLASGEGDGLANINPLEAISGKCFIICISEDKRNPQPSNDALEKADFIFFRTFDVGTHTINDTLPDKIADTKVEFLLNQNGCSIIGKAKVDTSQDISNTETIKFGATKEKIVVPGQAPSSALSKEKAAEKKHQSEPKHNLDGKNNPKSKISQDIGKDNSVTHHVDDIAKSVIAKSDVCDNKASSGKSKTDACNDKVPKTAQLEDKAIEKKHKNETNQNLWGHGDSKVKVESSQEGETANNDYCVDEKVTSAKHKAESDLCSDKPSKKSKTGDGSSKSADLQNIKYATGMKNVVSKSDQDNSENVIVNSRKVQSSDESQSEDPLADSAKNKPNHNLGRNNDQKLKIKYSGDGGEAIKHSGDGGEANNIQKVTSIRHKAESDVCSNEPSMKMKKGDGSLEPDDLQKGKHNTGMKNVVSKPNHENLEKIKLNGKQVKSSNESLSKVPLADSAKNNTTVVDQIIEVTRRPDTERSKWFRGPSWEDRIPKAHNQRTLMFLQYFGRSLTSAAIEDIIFSTFKQSCNAKALPILPPYQSSHYGQAYVIFKTPEVTDETIKKINTGCLMSSDGSFFFASKGMLEKPEKASKLPGHLSINTKRPQREEMRNAVSTSHCSQPNTIEYEMALEWVLLQEKTVGRFKALHKMQDDEITKVMKNLKTKKQ